MSKEPDVLKKPRAVLPYTKEELISLAYCADDPIYFIKNFVKIQHAIKGIMPFEPYDFQYELINAFHNQRYTIALTARQMGKCVTYDAIIEDDGKRVPIGSKIASVSFYERIITRLERLMLWFAVRQ